MFKKPSQDNSFDKYDEMRLHMEHLYATSLLEFDLSPRITIPLGDAGIRTVGQLLSHTREDLLQIKQLGVKSVNEIERTMNRFDLFLRVKK